MRIIAPRFGEPVVKSRSDLNDAEAMVEAASGPRVSGKSGVDLVARRDDDGRDVDFEVAALDLDLGAAHFGRRVRLAVHHGQ